MERLNPIVLPTSTLTSKQTVGRYSPHQWYQDDGHGGDRTAGRLHLHSQNAFFFEGGSVIIFIYYTKVCTSIKKS